MTTVCNLLLHSLNFHGLTVLYRMPVLCACFLLSFWCSSRFKSYRKHGSWLLLLAAPCTPSLAHNISPFHSRFLFYEVSFTSQVYSSIQILLNIVKTDGVVNNNAEQAICHYPGRRRWYVETCGILPTALTCTPITDWPRRMRVHSHSGLVHWLADLC